MNMYLSFNKSTWSLGDQYLYYSSLDIYSQFILDGISSSDPITDKIYNALGTEFQFIYTAFDNGFYYNFPAPYYGSPTSNTSLLKTK